MYVVEVIPLSVLPPNVPQILSYYHDDDLQKGAVVEVLVNNRKVTAIVVGSSEIGQQKIFLKKSLFQLKKISRIINPEPQVSEFQFKIALWLASEYVSPLGSTLKHVLPPFFLKKKYPLGPIVEVPAQKPEKGLAILSRAKNIFNAVAPYLKKNDGQILIVVPEVSYISYFEKNFPERELITSGTSNKDFYDVWNKAREVNSKVFIGTRQALFLPFKNLKKLVVVDPLHEFYKSDMSPKYRTPHLAKMISNLYGAQLITVSNLLSPEGYNALNNKEIEVKDTIAPWQTDAEVIDLVAEQKIGYVGLFTSKVKQQIKEVLEKRGKILIFSARRGYQGIIVCQKCGFTFRCEQCNNPLKVHQGIELVLVCHHDSTTKPYPHFCANCHSSNIKPVGPVGSQKIFEEIQQMIERSQIPKTPVLVLDADITKNQTEEDEVINEFKRDGSGVLIATQKVFSYIFDLSFDYIVMPQFDALASSADFQTSERLWYQLEKLADFEPKFLSIQTYHKQPETELIARHDYNQIYSEELKNRELFGYPPFSRIVKLTFSHKNLAKVRQEGRIAVEKLKMAAVHLRAADYVKISETSPLFLKKDKGIFTYTIVIKVLPGLKSMRELIRFVPSAWLIDIDPRSIL